MKRKSKRRSSLKRKNFYKRSRKIRRTRKRRTNTKKERRTRKKMAMRGGSNNELQEGIKEARAMAQNASPTQIIGDERRGSMTPETAVFLDAQDFRESKPLPDLGVDTSQMNVAQAQEAVRRVGEIPETKERVTKDMLESTEDLDTYNENFQVPIDSLNAEMGETQAATQEHANMVQSTKQVITNLGTRIRVNDAQITRYQGLIKKLLEEIKIKTKEHEKLKSTSADAATIGKHVEEIEGLKQQLKDMETQYKDKILMKDVYKIMVNQIMEKFKEKTANIKQLLEEKRAQSHAITDTIINNLQDMVKNYIFLKHYVYPPEGCPQDLQAAINGGIALIDQLGVMIGGHRPDETLLLNDVQDEINTLMRDAPGDPIYQDGINRSVQFLLNQDNSEELIGQAMQEAGEIHDNKKINLAMKVIELESINDLLIEAETEGERQILRDSRDRVKGEIQQLGEQTGSLSQGIQGLISAQAPNYAPPAAGPP